jgi:release factor glutamine methyltransferase
VNIAEALTLCSIKLKGANVPDPRKDAALLISFVTGRDKTYLIAHPEIELTQEQGSALFEVVSRRASREPLQYITGSQEFFRLEFEVTPDVLIPRPETEILVERAIEFLRSQPDPRFCEIGIGSGAISVSVLHELPDASALACDISQNALEIARRNSDRHGVSDRLELIVSDVFASVPKEHFRAVLSNPPYVREPDLAALQPEVRDHEPVIALTSGPDGLRVIEKLIEHSPSYLMTGGALLFEMGFDQSARVREMLDDNVWKDIEFLPDLQGIQRILFAAKR